MLASSALDNSGCVGKENSCRPQTQWKQNHKDFGLPFHSLPHPHCFSPSHTAASHSFPFCFSWELASWLWCVWWRRAGYFPGWVIMKGNRWSTSSLRWRTSSLYISAELRNKGMILQKSNVFPTGPLFCLKATIRPPPKLLWGKKSSF